MKRLIMLLIAIIMFSTVNIYASTAVLNTEFGEMVCKSFKITKNEYKTKYPSTDEFIKYDDAIRIIVTELNLSRVAELEGGYPEGYNYVAGILGITTPGIISNKNLITLQQAEEIFDKIKNERAEEIRKYKEYVFFYSKIDKLKINFPDKAYWNHNSDAENNSNGYTYIPCAHEDKELHGNCNTYDGSCGCNSYNKAIQCYGFALKIANELTGGDARTWKKHSDFNALFLGDIVMFRGHYMVVIEKDADGINVLEANYDGCCRIDWGRRIDRETLEECITEANMENGSAFFMTPAVYQ